MSGRQPVAKTQFASLEVISSSYLQIGCLILSRGTFSLHGQQCSSESVERLRNFFVVGSLGQRFEASVSFRIPS